MRLLLRTEVLATVVVTLALGACASSAPVGPNGGKLQSVQCDGSGIDSCYQPAAKACPNGYTFVDPQAKSGGTSRPSGNGFFAPGSNTVMAECRK